MKFKTVEKTLADAISEAFGELSSLAEEMRNWADAIEEKFGSTEKYERINETADTLEGISESDVPERLQKVMVSISEPVYSPSKLRKLSRADRCGDACSLLQQCVEFLDEFEVKDSQDTPPADAGDLSAELSSAKDEAEAVEFPGMYG